MGNILPVRSCCGVGGNDTFLPEEPLTDEPFIYQAGALPPFFTGLLPEGRRLTSLRNTLKVSKDDELSLLLAVGADTVGDVRVLPPGSVPNNEYLQPITEFNPTQLSSISFADFFSAQGLVDYATLPGVQEKVSGKMLTIPLRHHHNFYH
ncbi:HipA N-terminal domain-containing protein [Rothia sp. 88186D007BW]